MELRTRVDGLSSPQARLHLRTTKTHSGHRPRGPIAMQQTDAACPENWYVRAISSAARGLNDAAGVHFACWRCASRVAACRHRPGFAQAGTCRCDDLGIVDNCHTLCEWFLT